MDISFTGKTALVTGAGSGIGEAIALGLAASGARVVVQDLKQEAAERVAQAITQAGGTARAAAGDVADAATVERLVAEAANWAGGLQLLVNNAGIGGAQAPTGEYPLDGWQRVIDVNLNAFYNVCQPLTLPMIRTRWGRIIAISSVAGQVGNRGQANYAAAKAGLHGACRSLALEVASRGITVNCVAPGIITSDMSSNFDAAAIERLVPMKRPGRPEEVAAVVGFLASEPAGYVSGQVIGVNGAMV